MEIAKIILEYLKIFIWPIIVLLIFLKYNKYIIRLFQRIAEESEEIYSSLLGLGAKFGKKVSELSKEIPNTESVIKENLNRTVSEFSKGQFKLLCTNFLLQPKKVRIKTAEQISELTKDMELLDVLEFLHSSLPGERLGAAIGIGTHLKISDKTQSVEKVVNALRDGLSDSHSRVRFRIVEAIGKSEKLVNQFKAKLSSIAAHDGNSVVRNKAKEVLRRY